MKKLKIILPIFLISLFVFIGNVSALTNFTNRDIPVIDSYMQTTGNTIGDFRKFVLDNTYDFTNDLEFENYIVILERTVSPYLTIYYFNADDFSLGLNNAVMYLRTKGNSNSKYKYINYRFNSDYSEITQTNDYSYQYNFNFLALTPNGNGQIDYIVLASNLNEIQYTNPTWTRSDFTIDNGQTYTFGSNVPLIEFNKRYNLPVIDYFSNPIPTIQPPYNIYKNGYTETTFIINNYTEKSNVNGYFIRIINNNNGNIEGIAPDYANPDREITLTSYENTNYTIQIYDREYNIIQEYSINANINYETNTNFSIEITDIDNSTREVFYKYIISNSDQNYTCYHSINNNAFIQDIDCTDTSTVYYNLTMPNNGNLAFKIEDANNNIVYEYDQNIVFNVSDTYISFKDNFDNNYLNLNVLINRYQTNDIVEYSINNSSFIQANLEEYSSIQGIKNFYINNLNNNDILNVRVKRNNEIITYATYKANYLKYYNNSEEDYNISNIFEKINIENINNELKEYIKNFGNLIINSKIGNLLLLQTFCLVIILIIKMIRN